MGIFNLFKRDYEQGNKEVEKKHAQQIKKIRERSEKRARKQIEKWEKRKVREMENLVNDLKMKKRS